MKCDRRLVTRREHTHGSDCIVPVALKQAGYMDHIRVQLMQKVFAYLFCSASAPCIGRIYFSGVQWRAEDPNPPWRYQSSESMP